MRLEYFQMLDEIESLDLAQASLIAVARVPQESPIFEGHFPGHPIMPGALLLETMAQAAGYLLMAVDGFSRMPFFAAVRSAGFRAFVAPGATLKVSASRIHAGSGYAVVATSIECAGARASDAELTLRTLPFPNEALARHVQREGERLGLREIEAR